jgi:type IV pilus assembly protein PilB
MAEVVSHLSISIIRERGMIDDMQLEEVSAEFNRTGCPMGEILNDYGLVDNDTQLQLIAEHLGTEVANLAEVEFTPELIEAVPASAARMYQCLPVAVFGDTVRVALMDPLNPAVLDELAMSLGKQVQVVVADPVQIGKQIEKNYPQEAGGMGDLLKELGIDEEIARASRRAGTV